MTVFVRTVVFMLALAFVCACGAMENWRGDYGYQAAEGQTLAGTPIVVDFALHIDEETCRLNIDGYQIAEEILCRAVADDSRLTIRFKSYEDGSLTNVYGVRVYQPDEVLFVLSRRNGKLVTHWESVHPGEKAPPDGFYFTRE